MSVKSQQSRPSQRGVSIVEALVAIVVLSVGLLGIAGLHVETMRASRSALVRTQAINLTNDLTDRIRSNRFGQAAYALGVGATPAQLGCVVANNCTAAQLAQDDLARWVQAVRTMLPWYAAGAAPQTQVVFVPAPAAGQPDQYTVTIRWREPNEQADFVQQTILRIVPIAPL